MIILDSVGRRISRVLIQAPPIDYSPPIQSHAMEIFFCHRQASQIIRTLNFILESLGAHPF